MSFAARITGEEWFEPEKPGIPHRVITEVSRLLDVCACTWPAYDKPSIETATRSEAARSVRQLPDGDQPPRRSTEVQRRLSEWIHNGYRRTTKPKFAKKLPTRRGCGHATEIGGGF